ncbi:MAG: hypothetical protein ACKV19_14795 [Verrucomicrobiales bacterium]
MSQLARETGSSRTELLDAALESFRRLRILELTQAGYLALAEEKAGWDAYGREIRESDGTTGDGLDSYTP